jgi:CPA2 family monovalent cation:H+ antiporter-2
MEVGINLKIVFILTVGFTFASILGYLTFKAKLSPLLGYLFAGYLIGPFSPGFVADIKLAEQLAEIGVILMMFGVGLHFKWQDLVKVKNIAIPGAFIQTLVAGISGAYLIYALGWGLEVGIIFGLAIGVASTVVLIRVLTDNKLTKTEEGHIAIGWLIVEDIITIAILLLIPSLSRSSTGHTISFPDLSLSLGYAFCKFILLIGFMFTVGRKAIHIILEKILKTKSHELFTLVTLTLTFLVASGSALLFGTSIALGAFIAGMVIGQSDVKHQVSHNALPLKDTFVVIFFLSAGMLFNPAAIVEQFPLFIGTLGIILIVKPLTAFLLTIGLKYPWRTALVIATALAQIGEFSFILAEEALKYKILPDAAFDIIVACSLISISINPLLFKLLPPIPTAKKI